VGPHMMGPAVTKLQTHMGCRPCHDTVACSPADRRALLCDHSPIHVHAWQSPFTSVSANRPHTSIAVAAFPEGPTADSRTNEQVMEAVAVVTLAGSC
jgi:hypothetical protein